ncbi:SpoIIIAH-like family protein [Paenibacillus lemnae]|uniref:SpoIIIAH-like family protein n=1 Tax=Paenibacillus lemnae TaxID=1330551 RepID=A0A848M9D7_PAELE|nr:SpoIIIAH-like family protein [Paenibacillus lemnae]NMO96879.1 SpoIIIAH-like family protein [Paenibacillus lemnae]
MNNKRQTIWLVSMLSLMVILSAYYLFTEDAGPAAPPVAEGTTSIGQQSNSGTETANNEIIIDEVVEEGTDGDAGEANGAPAANESSPDGDAAGSDTSKPESKTNSAAATDKPVEEPKVSESEAAVNTDKETAKTEKEILEEVAAVQAGSASAKLESYQLDRANKNMKLYEELMAKLDNQETTPDETAKVTEQMKTLEEKESILYAIEEQLQQQYENAVVKEENDRYNVVVLSEKLDAKNAAGIVSMIMKELKVSQDKVSVQYVAP